MSLKTSHKFQSICNKLPNLFKHGTSSHLSCYPTPPGSPTVSPIQMPVNAIKEGTNEADLVALLGNTNTAGTIYALARLRLFNRLPEEYNAMLSQLIADEKLLLSFYDPPASPVTAFHCVVGAQEAMDMVLSQNNVNALRNILASYKVAPQDYVVQVGFNEDLLDRGAGYLEEIYIYLSKEVEGQVSCMLDCLAVLFHPLPCVLLTPEKSYRIPGPPGFPLGFDNVILERAKKDHQVLTLRRRGAAEPQEGGSNWDGGSTGSRNGSGKGDDKSKSASPNNNSSGPGQDDNGKAGKSPDDQENTGPSKTQPNVAMTEGRTITPSASCYSNITLSIPTLSLNPSLNNLDTHDFSMNAAVTVDVQPPVDDIDSPVSLQFKILDAETAPKDAQHLYQHTKIKVVVDSEDERVHPFDYGPMPTLAAGPTVTHTHSHEWTRGGSVSVGRTGILGIININRRANDTDEVVRNVQRCAVYRQVSRVTWEYDACDTYQQQRGMRVEVGRLPFVEFWPERHAQIRKPFSVELTSYWSTRMPKKGSKFLPLPAFWKHQPVPLLRNFCHVTCMRLPSDLSKVTTLQLQLDARMEGSAIFLTSKSSSSDLDEATVDGDVEPLNPVGIDSGGRRISRLLRLHRR